MLHAVNLAIRHLFHFHEGQSDSLVGLIKEKNAATSSARPRFGRL